MTAARAAPFLQSCESLVSAGLNMRKPERPYGPPRALMPSRSLAIVAVILFAASLALPAFVCPMGVVGYRGYHVLATGWAGLLGLDPRWFANIGFLVLVARSLVAPGKLPWVAGATALLAVLSIAPAGGCPAPGGAPAMSAGLAIGGWLWVAAMVCASAANLMSVRADQASGA